MVERAISVNHIPTMMGGVGHDQLKRFYKYHFIGVNPPDFRLTPVSRTVAPIMLSLMNSLCTSLTTGIDWLLPGVPPTGRVVEVPTVGIVKFQGDKLVHEHIYWDQTSVRVQVGLLDPVDLPGAGTQTPRKCLDKNQPSNQLMSVEAESEGKPL